MHLPVSYIPWNTPMTPPNLTFLNPTFCITGYINSLSQQGYIYNIKLENDSVTQTFLPGFRVGTSCVLHFLHNG